MDEVVWQIINHRFCSFKAKTTVQTFCRNPYNVSGNCLRSSCPLANSRYATIVEKDGVCFLYLKEVERSHAPKRLWEKMKLPANYTAALEKIESALEYFPKYLKHKTKQRLTKIHQYLIRMRKLKKKLAPRLVRVNKKEERQEAKKEMKAVQAAQLDKAIEKELLARLKEGTYGEIYNYPLKHFEKALEEEELEAQDDMEGEELYEDIEELGDDFELNDASEFLSKSRDAEDSDSDDEEPPMKRRRQQGKGRIEIEYEEELDNQRNVS